MERQSVGTHQIIPDPPPGFLPDDILSDISGPPAGFVLDQEQGKTEADFQKWYANISQKKGLNPNPDDPKHHYDYRAAYHAGMSPDESGHWPSEFKTADHPNRFVNGIDTITGKSIASSFSDVNSLPQGFVIDTEKTPSGAGGSFERPSLLKMAGDVALATPELAATLGSGMAAFPVSGLAGMAGLPFGKATEWQEKTAQAMTYEPRTELGKETTELAMKPFEALGKAAKWWGDKTFETTGSPELAAVVASGIEAAAYLGLPKLGIKLKKSLKAGRLKQTRSILDEIIEQDKRIAEKNKREPLFPEMLKNEVKKYGEKKPVQTERTLTDTLTDIKTTLDERGSLSFEDLTKEQKAAIDRLTKDAKKAGKAVKDFLVDQGFTAESAAVLQKYVEKPTEPLPKYAQSVNLEKQVLSDSTKRLELELAGEKKTQSWDVTGEKGRAILADVKRTNRVLEKAKAGEGLNTAEIHAIRQVNVSGIDRLAKMADDAVAGKLSPEDFNNQFTTFRDDIFVVASDASSEIGRALNYHKKEISVNRIARAFSKLEKGLNDRQLKEFQRLNTDNPAEVKRFLERLPDPKLKDYVIEYWYNAILSGIPTHVVNTASNTAWLAYQVPHRVHTALWDKVLTTFTGKARSRYLNEAVPMMAGYASGFKRGRRSAGQMMRTGELAEFETKWAQEMGTSSLGSWERSPKKWMRKAAPAVTVFTRALRAMDVWANSIAYDGEINSIARRVANRQGLTGEKRLEFERNYKRTLPDKAHEQAMKQAKHSTFMDDPDPFTAWVLRLRKVPVLGPGSQFIIPFVNTIGNLTKRGIEFTPGLGIAKEVVSRKMGRGMPTPDIVAKQVEGALLTLYILYKVDKGEIIGQSPKSKNERDAMYRQGKKPWSIKKGDTWIQYRRAEPWNTVIASVAIAHDRIKNAKDDATRTEIFGECARGLTDNLIDSSYFQGMQQVFNKNEKFKEAPFRFAASFVPYSSFWRSLNRAYEKYSEGEAKVREKSGWLSAFAQVIPGLSGNIPAELNAWGEEKINPGSVFQHWLPYKWVQEKDDITEKALARLEIYPGLPGQHVTILDKKVKLDEDVYRKYCIDYGHRAKKRLDSFFTRSMYQKAAKTERFDQHTIERIDKFLTEIRTRSRRRAIVEQRKKNHLVRINGETS